MALNQDQAAVPLVSPKSPRINTAVFPSRWPEMALHTLSLTPSPNPPPRTPTTTWLRATLSTPPLLPPRPLDTPRYGTTCGFRSWFHPPRNWALPGLWSPWFSRQLSGGTTVETCPCRVAQRRMLSSISGRWSESSATPETAHPGGSMTRRPPRTLLHLTWSSWSLLVLESFRLYTMNPLKFYTRFSQNLVCWTGNICHCVSSEFAN